LLLLHMSIPSSAFLFLKLMNKYILKEEEESKIRTEVWVNSHHHR
jgi:hypothetical protein